MIEAAGRQFAAPPLASKRFRLGKQNWGRLGKRFLKSGLKRQFLGKKRAFEAIFQNLDLPLTPSFVGSNPATPATDTIYCIRFSKSNTIYGFCFFCGFFLPLDCGEDRGVIVG